MTNEMSEAVFAAWAARVEGGEELEFADMVREHATHADELTKLHADWMLFAPLLGKVVPGLIGSEGAIVVKPLSSGGDDESAMPTDELVDRLGIKASNSGRYRFRSVLGKGGGGVVLKVWDTKLSRPLAMKVVLGRDERGRPSGDTPKVDSQRLTRFVDEARIASQLNHPGIVPVHELGADEMGRAYFTMKLVKGDDLSVVFEHVKTGKDDWNQTRALNVLQRVCEAMAFAHDKGVVHRDLKPANIMVGKFGEVYVMDWGLARVMGEEDHVELRVKPPSSTNASVLDSLRAAEQEGSPLLTVGGQALGTPAYMSPEQARGDVEAIGVRSDVYAIGAMLYELVAGRMPYVDPAVPVGPATMVDLVKRGPPEPLTKLAPRAPAELIAIAEKAMERDPAKRYANTQDLGADLRAFLEGHVVAAYETGTWAETKKLVRRNRALASSLAMVIVVAVTGLVWVGAKNTVVERTNVELAAANKKLVDRDGESRMRGLISELAYFESLDDDVGYARHQKRPAADWWLERAHQLVEGVKDDAVRGIDWSPGLKDVEDALNALRVKARERTPNEIEEDNIASSKADESTTAATRRTYHFADSRDEWWHGELVKLVEGLRWLPKKIEFAERSVRDADAQEAWSRAIAAISASEKYRDTKWPCGARLSPQMGLVPIGPDPESGLWEFAHLLTGKPARRGADKKIRPFPEMGLVLVLLPGGFVPVEESDEDPKCRLVQDKSVTNVDLDPFFLSKYEMTSGQWARIDGWRSGEPELSVALQPQVDMDWNDGAIAFARAGWLQLSTEAQWEYGCRAGTTTKWWPGNDEEELFDAENIVREGTESCALFDIGSLRGNMFGLYDMHGNATELCRDAYGWNGILLRRSGDGLYDDVNAEIHVIRGGGRGTSGTFSARSMWRMGARSVCHYGGYGLRPARAITP